MACFFILKQYFKRPIVSKNIQRKTNQLSIFLLWSSTIYTILFVHLTPLPMELLITLLIGLAAVLSLPFFLKLPKKKIDKTGSAPIPIPEGYMLVPNGKMPPSPAADPVSSALSRVAITILFGFFLLMAILMLSDPNPEGEELVRTPAPQGQERMIRLAP
jgi:hypothetical protein